MLFNRYPLILWDADGGGGGGGEPPADPPADPPKGDPGPVPYDRFKQVNDRAKELEQRLAKLEADQKTAKEKELADQQKWQELAEQRERELKAERHERLRLEVATAKGLPVDLAARLQGEDKVALEMDADNLLKFMKPSEGPGVPPAGKGGSQKPADFSKMTPEEIRKAVKDKSLADVL